MNALSPSLYLWLDQARRTEDQQLATHRRQVTQARRRARTHRGPKGSRDDRG